MIVKKQTLWLLSLIAMLSCGTSPEKSIHKRWLVADVKGKGHQEFIERNKKSEREFTKDGNVLWYENGVLKSTTPFTLASDNKSMLIYDPTYSSEGVRVEILKLNANEMILTSESFGRDTIYLQAK